MIKIKKKGEWGKLQELILAAIFAVIIIGFLLPQISSIITTGSNTQACKTWVTLQSRAKVGGVTIKEITSPCITDRKELPSNQEEIYQSIAESMYDCWDMYGQGKVDFFSDRKGIFEESDVYCYICSKTEVKDNVTIDLDKFGSYINSHNPPNTQNTYAQFLLESENAKVSFSEDGEQSTLELDTESPLYVIFHVTKKPDYSDSSMYGHALVETGLALFGLDMFKSAPGASTAARLSKKLILNAGGRTLLKGVKKAGPIGFGIIAAGTFATSLRSQAGEFYPSLVAISGKDVVKAGCDNDQIHYNPRKNILESIGKKDINEFI